MRECRYITDYEYKEIDEYGVETITPYQTENIIRLSPLGSKRRVQWVYFQPNREPTPYYGEWSE